jgi:hypothetical protein
MFFLFFDDITFASGIEHQPSKTQANITFASGIEH